MVISFLLSYKKNKFKPFYPHHLQVFFIVSIFILPTNNKTKFLSAMYLSFFAHGIIAHSAASMLKNN